MDKLDLPLLLLLLPEEEDDDDEELSEPLDDDDDPAFLLIWFLWPVAPAEGEFDLERERRLLALSIGYPFCYSARIWSRRARILASTSILFLTDCTGSLTVGLN